MHRRTFILTALAPCSPPAQKTSAPALAAPDPAAIVRLLYARCMPGAPEFV